VSNFKPKLAAMPIDSANNLERSVADMTAATEAEEKVGEA